MAIVLHLHDNRWCIQESVGTSGRISKFIDHYALVFYIITVIVQQNYFQICV